MSLNPICAQCAASPYAENYDTEVWCAACQLCRRCCRKNADEICRDAWGDDDEEEVSWYVEYRIYQAAIAEEAMLRSADRERNSAVEQPTHDALCGIVATVPFGFTIAGGDAHFFAFDSITFDGAKIRVDPHPVLLLGDTRRMLMSDLQVGDQLVLWGEERRRVVRTSPWTPPVEIDVFEAAQCMPWFTFELERLDAWLESDDEFLYPDEPSGKR